MRETSIRLHQATHVCTQGFRYKHSDFIKIRNADTNESKRLTLAKDIFLLSFYTAASILQTL